MDYVGSPRDHTGPCMVMQSSLSFLLALKDFIQQNPDMPFEAKSVCSGTGWTGVSKGCPISTDFFLLNWD